MIDDLNDSLDDLLGAPMGEVRVEPIRAAVDYKPREFTEPCPKCRGTGRYNGRSSHGSHCFKCDGKGVLTFKTSTEARSRNRVSANARKAKAAAEEAARKAAEVEAWKTANLDIYADIAAGAERGSQFAADMLAKLNHWGSLTEGQAAAIRRGMEKRAQAQAEAAARAEAAPVADGAGIDRLKQAFDKAIGRARARGRRIKWPRITIGTVVISPAGDNSKNPGALYVKDGGQYLGKVKDGRFFGGRDCTPEQEARVLAFIADPKAAAEAYGIETGICCICNAALTNKVSIERGIGPICAENMGW